LVTLIDVTDQFEAMCLLAFILPRSRNALDQTTATSTFGASSSRRPAALAQPPIIKIQCKRQKDQIGEPVVSQLLGTLGDGEYGMFVTLGSFSTAAKMRERNTHKLRLIDGKQIVDLIQDFYHKMLPLTGASCHFGKSMSLI